MKIHEEVFGKVRESNAQVLVVTKYLSKNETHEFLENVYSQYTHEIFGIGENRIEHIQEKQLPREKTHFIGNIQSKKISEIIKYCSVLHSLCSIKHAKLINEESQKQKLPISVFIQVNISRESQKSGVLPEELEVFLSELKPLKNIQISGISAIGAGEFDEIQKRKEFQELIRLRDAFFPEKKISAGTSRDYEIALQEGVEIVRIGTALFQ